MMTDIASYLSQHRFQDLFIEELGWDRASGTVELSADEHDFTLETVAQKRGVRVLHGQTDRLTLLNRGRLRRLQQKLATLIHEHIVIYSCQCPLRQVWQWAVRLPNGRGMRFREHPFFSHSPPEFLVLRLENLRFTLEEEANVTLIDALRRVRQALDHPAEFDLFVKRPWYAEESDRLARAMETGGEAELEAFILFHRPLVTWAVRPFVELFGGNVEDAEQAGLMGLLHAARRFQRSRGLQFSSYAVRCIEGYCKRQAPHWFLPIRVPMHVLWPCLKLRRRLERVLAQGGPAAVDAYLAKLVHREPALVREWTHFDRANNVRSLSQPSEPEYREARQLSARTKPLAVGAEQAERRRIICDAIAKLKPRDAAFVRLKYGFEGEVQTLEQIGNRYGVSRERVRQRLAVILSRLQRNLAPVLKLPFLPDE